MKCNVIEIRKNIIAFDLFYRKYFIGLDGKGLPIMDQWIRVEFFCKLELNKPVIEASSQRLSPHRDACTAKASKLHPYAVSSLFIICL